MTDNTFIDILDITPGTSYACKFTADHLLDANGSIPSEHAESSSLTLGEYAGFGIILTRDVENKLVEVQDQASGKKFVVAWDACREVDVVEWTTE